ncbi:MAG: holo-ACP synthase [Polyangiaceae bacterium]
MIVGLGIDVAGIERIARAIERFGDRFLCRLLTEAEKRYADSRTGDKATWVAGRLAVKEAASKALGVPPGIGWHDVEVLRTTSGAPELRFSGRALERAEERRVEISHVSISHDAGVACAVVVLEAR